ncbi:hypothetical protein [Mycolicibacterium sp.]|uniref:hypothetical protein n=1 Tax=Mycolicibacterium sp. TaxID=2320850 RepID=UPI001A18BF17|nr:hypothetical protein [Mycolicibacterium sp.]MBJ7339943.1 hypothetical protein [Mycolicibacterium sp.]
MKNILVVGVGALGCAAAAIALSSGIASADDGVVGQTYKDAKAALSQQGLTPVVASTVGDRKDWDSCIVTSATRAPGLDGFGNQSSGKMNVNLNCYSTYGTALWPGFSIQSPEGRKMHDADVAAKQQAQAEQAAAAQQSQDEQLAAANAQQGGE